MTSAQQKREGLKYIVLEWVRDDGRYIVFVRDSRLLQDPASEKYTLDLKERVLKPFGIGTGMRVADYVSVVKKGFNIVTHAEFEAGRLMEEYS